MNMMNKSCLCASCYHDETPHSSFRELIDRDVLKQLLRESRFKKLYRVKNKSRKKKERKCN